MSQDNIDLKLFKDTTLTKVRSIAPWWIAVEQDRLRACLCTTCNEEFPNSEAVISSSSWQGPTVKCSHT